MHALPFHRRALSRSLVLLILLSMAYAMPGSARGPELSLDPQSWWRLEGDQYVLFSDAHPRVAAQVLADLERFHDLFARLAPGLDLRSPAPVRFVAFRDARSFGPYKLGAEAAGTRILGQFARHSDAHYLLMDAGTRLDEAYSVIFHEFTHFLVTHNIPGAPLWLNEGLAEYYGTFGVVRRGSAEEPELHAVVGRPILRHLRFLFDDRRRVGRRGEPIPVGLERLLAADGPVSGHGPDAVGHFYAASWALTHYLLSGGSAGDTDRLDRTAAYLARLAQGEDAEEAFEDAFERTVEDMEEDVVDHLHELLREARRWDAEERAAELWGVGLRVSPDAVERVRVERAAPADVFTHLGDFVLHAGAVDFAEGHFDAALAADPRHAAAHVGLASVYDHRGFWHQAELLYRDARELGILAARDAPTKAGVSALALVRYGRHSLELHQGVPSSGAEAGRRALEDGAFERARTALERAVEIDPQYATAHQLLAAAHLLPGGDVKRGLRAAVAAREILPLDLDPLFLEARLRLRDGQFQRAEALIEGEIRDRANPAQVQDLRQESQMQRLLQGARAAFEDGDKARGLELLDRAVSAAADPERRRRLAEELARLSADSTD